MDKKKRSILAVTIVVIILIVIILMFGCSNKDKSRSLAGNSVQTGNISGDEVNGGDVATSGTADQNREEDASKEPTNEASKNETGTVTNAAGQTVTKAPTPVVTNSAGVSENTSEPIHGSSKVTSGATKVSTPTPVKASGPSGAVTPTKGATVTKSASGAVKTPTPTVKSSSGTVTKTPTPTKAGSQSAGITKAATPTPTKKVSVPTKAPTAVPTKTPTASPTQIPTKAPTATPTPHVVEYITEITEVERTFTTANTISRDGTITLWHFLHDTAPDYPYITSHVPGATAKNVQLDLDAGYSMSGVFVACCSMIGESYGGKTTRITAMSPVELAIGAKYSDGTVKYYSESECFVLKYLVCDICGKQHK